VCDAPLLQVPGCDYCGRGPREGVHLVALTVLGLLCHRCYVERGMPGGANVLAEPALPKRVARG
jgi:hypothetical protein